jgi:hypothetical protein
VARYVKITPVRLIITTGYLKFYGNATGVDERSLPVLLDGDFT